MSNDISNLLDKVYRIESPTIIANSISYFLSDRLKKRNISFYEAYMLNDEIIRFKRLGYLQPAWNGRVRISICLEILNQKLLANAFDEVSSAQQYKEWGIEAYKLNGEKRSHYILNRYLDFLDANLQPELLITLQEFRSKNNSLDFDEGPFHNEAFPYDYFSPETLLLDASMNDKYYQKEWLDENIQNLIIELSLL